MALIRIEAVASKLGGVHPSFAWKKLGADPQAPKAIKLGARLTVFDEAEVDRWIAGLVAQAKAKPVKRTLPSVDAIRRGVVTRKGRREAAKSAAAVA